MQKFKARLLLLGSNPIFIWLFKVTRDSIVGYLGATPFIPSKAWIVGLGFAVASGLVHAFEVWLQSQNANAPSSITKGDSSPVAMLKNILRMLFLFAFCFSVVGTASAYEWTIPTNAVKSTKIKTASMIPSGLDKNMVVGIPTAALAVGTVSTSYGLSVAYSALWCHVKGDADGTTSTLTSKFGVGAAAYGDFGDWLKSNFQTDPKLKVGVGVILPQMCGITPGVQLVWNVKDGSRTTVVTMNVPLNLLNSVIVKLF